MDMMAELQKAGFQADRCFESGVNPDLEAGTYPEWSARIGRHDHEHGSSSKQQSGYNGETWYLFGAWK
jgi:hypothetical protein